MGIISDFFETDLEPAANKTSSPDVKIEFASEPALTSTGTVSVPLPPAGPDHFAGPDDLDDVCAALEAASEISLDLETTHLTPWSKPLPAGKTVRIGDGTINQYMHDHPGCTLNNTPRARILAVETDSGLIAAIDLDQLTPNQKTRVIKAAARPDVTWVGHNLSFDLQFLNHLCPGARPGRIVDTMLMTTALRPDTEYDVLRRVVEQEGSGDPIIDAMREAVTKRAARAGRSVTDDAGAVSLDLLSMHFLSEKLDKAYQKPENWMFSHLTAAHLKYVLGDIRQPRVIARRMLGLPDHATISSVLKAVDAAPGGAAYKIFEAAVPRLVQMQHTGLRIDAEAAGKYREKLQTNLESVVDQLVTVAPIFGAHRQALLDTKAGLTADLKKAVADALKAATGVEIGKTETGDPMLSAKDLIVRFDDHAIVKKWLGVQAAAKIIAMLDEYVYRADFDQRLHPLVSIATLTGRTSSQEPNLQNMPRAPEFRAVFKASPGFKIIATDFSAVEMRIAACLALRNYSKAVQSKFMLPKWIYRAVEGSPYDAITRKIIAQKPALADLPSDWPLPEPKPGESSIDDYALYYASRHATALARLQATGCGMRCDPDVMRGDRSKMALSGAFSRGIDPHLLTAIQTEVRAGRFEIPGGVSALVYLQELDPDGRKQLKDQMKKPRTAAKALNFGLLYGMTANGLHKYGITNYGLDWGLDEARTARAAWFELYPEIDLWHLMLTLSHHNEKRPVRKYGKIAVGQGAKLFRHTTLSGRPVCGPAMRNAANYADQGTGAEIALDAVARCSDFLAARLVNFVHDEFVFEVEQDRAEEAREEIERVMNAAADAYFEKYAVKSEVESAIDDVWIH